MTHSLGEAPFHHIHYHTGVDFMTGHYLIANHVEYRKQKALLSDNTFGKKD